MPGNTDRLGVAMGGHSRSFEELLDLTRHAERLGYEAVFPDGDVSVVDGRGEGDVLDGWTVTTALLMATSRIQVGSIRVVTHWNAARLAQAAATLDRVAPGRLRFLTAIGDQRADRRFGLPDLAPRDRIAMLDETLDAVRALWRGESVTRAGRWVHLERARVRPAPGALPVAVAARRPRLLEIVARHADVWDVNLPPVRARVLEAASYLEDACRRQGRDPASIGRSLWLFARPGSDPDDPRLVREFRSMNPWFGDIGDDELSEAIVAGDASVCRERVRALSGDLGIELPILDCSWLDADATRHILDAMAPGRALVDSANPTP